MVLLLLILIGGIACAILAELETGKDPVPRQQGQCPCCGQAADADWMICPHCRSMLREHCDHCGEPRAAWHRFCSRCGASAAGRDA